jgi:hypothetical protein
VGILRIVQEMEMGVFRQDVIAGTFTHRSDYVLDLARSFYRLFPDVPFVVQMAPLPVYRNMLKLREIFASSGKRFWLFLDDDVQFVYPDTLDVAVKSMIRNGWSVCAAYSSHSEEVLTNPHYIDFSLLREFPCGWAVGYFMMVDSRKLSDFPPEGLEFPDENCAIDISICAYVRMLGHGIGTAPTLVYHRPRDQKKPEPGFTEEGANRSILYISQRLPLFSEMYWPAPIPYEVIVGGSS